MKMQRAVIRTGGHAAAVAAAFLAAFGATSAQGTGVTHVLQPGSYQVEVISENPATGEQRTVRRVERCLEAPAIVKHEVFAILSDIPASACPKYEVCAGDTRTGFIARCAPADAPTAVGMFALEAAAFRGRIEVKDGAGKVTDVEIQYGLRTGPCDAAVAAP
jgi:hypothetical protein